MSSRLLYQVINAIVLDTPAKKSSFMVTFKNAVAAVLMITPSDVVIVSVDSTRRRLENGGTVEMLDNRPFLQATGGVTVMYTITAQSTLVFITNTLNSVGFSSGVNSALSVDYPGASVASASVNTPSPSRAPVTAVSACHKFYPNTVITVFIISVTLICNHILQ